MRTVIIDDEKKSVDLLCWLIENYSPQLEVVAVFTSSKIALDQIDSLAPELILIDIQMPWFSGFAFAEKINYLSAKIIFITGHFGPLTQELKRKKVYHLIKPISAIDFQELIAKVIENSNDNPSIKTLRILESFF